MVSINFKAMSITLTVCLIISSVIDYFSGFHWLPTFFFVLAAVFINGLLITIEGRDPGGLDFVENESEESKNQFRRSTLVTKLIIVAAVVMGFVAVAFVGA